MRRHSRRCAEISVYAAFERREYLGGAWRSGEMGACSAAMTSTPSRLSVALPSVALLSVGLLSTLLALGCDRGPATPAPSEELPTHDPSEAHAERQAPPRHGTSDPHAEMAGGAAAPQIDPRLPQLAGMKWEAREPLTWRAPTRPMRNAEYVVSAGEDEAVLTVFHFPGMGGSVQENVDRWVAQFKTADGEPVGDAAKSVTKTIGGMEVTTIDVTGTFASSMGMGGGAPMDNHRLLGAIVSAPSGPVFFKLLGPAPTVQSAKGAFDALITSVEATE